MKSYPGGKEKPTPPDREWARFDCGMKMNPMTRREALRAFVSTPTATLSTSKYGRDSAANPDERTIPVRFAPVRKYILQAISRGEATGVAVAVAHNGRIVWEEGFGWANRDAGLKVSPRTPFSLASITKPFTTTMLTTLAAEGRLLLDDPANKHLPTNKIGGPNGNPGGATIRRLGAHVGGLPTMFEGYFSNEVALAPSPGTLLSDYGQLAYPPGSIYEYSNIGFGALGAIASNLTGKDFGALVTERVLRPLQLNDSFFDTDVAQLPRSAMRYDGSGQPIHFYTTSTPASGELYASARDLARFAMLHMPNGLSGQATILNRNWIDEIHKPVFTGPSGVASTFGWFSGSLRPGLRTVFKTGGQPGVATLVYMVPSENLACLALSNRSNGQELTHSVCHQMLSIYFPDAMLPPEDAGPKPSPFVASDDLAGLWTGELRNGGANMRVALQITSSNSVTLALGDQPARNVTDMHSAEAAFEGASTGLIDAADAIRSRATTLNVKLIPHQGRLLGRLLATGGNPDTMNSMLPYVVTLGRASR